MKKQSSEQKIIAKPTHKSGQSAKSKNGAQKALNKSVDLRLLVVVGETVMEEVGAASPEMGTVGIWPVPSVEAVV